MKKRVLMAVGGTGGHLFPAISLAEELMEEGYEVHLAGAKLASHTLQESFPTSFSDVSSAPPFQKNPFKALKAWGTLLKGTLESLQVLKSYQPDLIVGFGSYHSAPLLFAALIRRTPIVLHVRDSIPGKVERFFSRFAKQSIVHFPGSEKYLSGETATARMPLRKNLLHPPSKEEALAHYGLDPKVTTVLAFGGSLGAKHLNDLAAHAIQQLVDQGKSLQVIHLFGSEEEAAIYLPLYKKWGVQGVFLPFEKEMQYAWAAADLSITRAGAGTISEQIHFAVPGVLIPYPFAADQHQTKNARLFQEGSDAVTLLLEKELTVDKLATAVDKLLLDKDAKRERLQAYAARQGQTQLSTLVERWLT